jgi:hypothetical protein
MKRREAYRDIKNVASGVSSKCIKGRKVEILDNLEFGIRFPECYHSVEKMRNYQTYSINHAVGRFEPRPSNIGITEDGFVGQRYLEANYNVLIDNARSKLQQYGDIIVEQEFAEMEKGWEMSYQKPFAERIETVARPLMVEYYSKGRHDPKVRQVRTKVVEKMKRVINRYKNGRGFPCSMEESFRTLKRNAGRGFPWFVNLGDVDKDELIAFSNEILENPDRWKDFPINILCRVVPGPKGHAKNAKPRSIKRYPKTIGLIENSFFKKILHTIRRIPCFAYLRGEEYVTWFQTKILDVSAQHGIPIHSLDVSGFDDDNTGFRLDIVLRPLFKEIFTAKYHPTIDILFDVYTQSDYLGPGRCLFSGRKGSIPSGSFFTRRGGCLISLFYIMFSLEWHGIEYNEFDLVEKQCIIRGDDRNVTVKQLDLSILVTGYGLWGLLLHPDKTLVRVGESKFCQLQRTRRRKMLTFRFSESGDHVCGGQRSIVKHFKACSGYEFARVRYFAEECAVRIRQLEASRYNFHFVDMCYITRLIDPLLLGYCSSVYEPTGILRRVGRMRTGTLRDIIKNNKLYDFIYIDPGVSSVPVECLRSVKALKWLYDEGYFDKVIMRKEEGNFDYRVYLDNYEFRFSHVNVHTMEPYGRILPLEFEDIDDHNGMDPKPQVRFNVDGSVEFEMATKPILRYASLCLFFLSVSTI